MILSSHLTQLLTFLHPPHCHRIPASPAYPYFWSYPWPILLLQSYLLFHSPTSSSSPFLANHARPIRILLLLPQLILVCRTAFAYRFVRPDGYIPHPWMIVGERNLDFVSGVMAAYCFAKTIDLAIFIHTPKLDHGRRDKDGEAVDAINRPSSQKPSLLKANTKAEKETIVAQSSEDGYYFPNTSIPLWIDLVFNLHGVGWEWGIPSPASSPRKVASTLCHPETRHFLRSRVWIVFYLVLLIHWSHGVYTDPRYMAAFDHPIGSLSTQPYHSSPLAVVLVQSIFTLSLGSLVLATIQATFAILSILSVLFSPRTQNWWKPLPFDAPYLSTSLKDLWGKRWHALFRRVWYILAYRPVQLLSRKVGLGKRTSNFLAITATFAMSGLFHEIGQHILRKSSTTTTMTMTMMSSSSSSSSLAQEDLYVCPPLDKRTQGFGSNSFQTLKFFLFQALGILLEDLFSSLFLPSSSSFNKKVPSRWRKNGILGWIWVLTWCGLTGRGLVQTWIWHGFIDDVSIPNKTFLSQTLPQGFFHLVVTLATYIADYSSQ